MAIENINNTDRKSSLFVDDRTLTFFQRVNTELIECVSQQKLRYYSIDSTRTKADDLYGEASEGKIFRTPIEIYCLILYNAPIVSTGSFSTETQYSLKFYVQKFRIEQDIKVAVQIGDFVEFGQKYYEISKVWEEQLIAGQDIAGFKIGTYAEALSTRADVFSPNRNSVYDPSFNSNVIR